MEHLHNNNKVYRAYIMFLIAFVSQKCQRAHTWSWILYWSWRWQYKESPGNLWLAWMLGACLFWLAMCPGEPLTELLMNCNDFCFNSLKNLVQPSGMTAEPLHRSLALSPSGFNWNDQTQSKNRKKFCFSAGSRGGKLPTWKTREETSFGQSPARPELKLTSNSFGSIWRRLGFHFQFCQQLSRGTPPTVFVNIQNCCSNLAFYRTTLVKARQA